MDIERVRAWWWHQQALDGRLVGSDPADILAETGWSRSVGGAGPYLTLFSRGRLGRQDVDAALVSQAIHELPSARGCTYVVPAADYALALKVGHPFGDQEARTAHKLGVSDKEIDTLCRAVLDALQRRPMEPRELFEEVGEAARSLGEEGKKKGLSTTLPVALGRLQARGEIRRIPTNGRLDQQRYAYGLWRPNPLAGFGLSAEEANTELARRYFRWAGPASLGAFRWFSGLGVGATRAAVRPLGLVPVYDDDARLLFPDQKEALDAFHVPPLPDYRLVSSLDGLFLLRRDVAGLLAEEHMQRPVLAGRAYQAIGGLTDLPSHAIVDRGRLVGLWEYDVDTQSIAWLAFQDPHPALERAVFDTEDFIRSQLGDARSFSLDSPKSRIPRIEALRGSA